MSIHPAVPLWSIERGESRNLLKRRRHGVCRFAVHQDQAKDLYRKALDLYAELGRQAVKTPPYYTGYAVASKRLGAILIVENALPEAEIRYRTALGMEDALCAASPEDSDLRINRTFTLSDLALILRKKGDHAGSAALFEQVMETRRDAMEKDPRNARLIRLTASTAERLARSYSALARHRDAIRLGHEAVRLQDLDAAKTQDYAEKRAAAQMRVDLAFLITDAAEERNFRAEAGERLTDARKAMQEAAALMESPKDGQTLSPAERQLQADFQTMSKRLKEMRQ